ncbi:hypothetical protein PoB_006812600 [Plakobranchus ocellatus]|uniref:Uncharacterized protein n=1 Tax=Plakobranchus ocellatus TaxID=259542 RepID=A0AAV4DBV1_9GAST|nr:hypothetical protein PoB_006812600 [Plakobranchus ocellatus]
MKLPDCDPAREQNKPKSRAFSMCYKESTSAFSERTCDLALALITSKHSLCSHLEGIPRSSSENPISQGDKQAKEAEGRLRSSSGNLTSQGDQQEKDDERVRVLAKKRDQGDHECEVFGAGCEAAEGSQAWKNCKKNPGHKRFIPVPEFCIDNLPEGYRTQSFFDEVKRFSDFVVRVKVGYTSEKRPKGYSFHKFKGTHILHTGSGLLFHIDTYEGNSVRPDVSTNEDNKDRPHQKWHIVSLVTACHVVYNSEEAKETTVDFFYNDEDSKKDGRMKSLQVHEMSKKDIHGDLCILDCVTHDDGLIEQLQLILLPHFKANPFFKTREKLQSQEKSLCIVISHPHGRPKQITVGYAESHELGYSSPPKLTFIYKTDTCPGSSGGLVVMYNLNSPLLNFVSAIHSLGHEDSNQSSKGLPENIDRHRIRHNLKKLNHLALSHYSILKSHCVNPLFLGQGWYQLKNSKYYQSINGTDI